MIPGLETYTPKHTVSYYRANRFRSSGTFTKGGREWHDGGSMNRMPKIIAIRFDKSIKRRIFGTATLVALMSTLGSQD